MSHDCLKNMVLQLNYLGDLDERELRELPLEDLLAPERLEPPPEPLE